MKKINYNRFVSNMMRFASVADTPDAIIGYLLKYICDELHSDRAYIFEDNHDGTFDNTYEYCKEGVQPQIDNLKRVPFEAVKVWYKEFEKYNNILIYDLEEYRKVSEAAYSYLKPQGIETLVAGPLRHNGEFVGFFGVDNPPMDDMKEISELISVIDFALKMMLRIRNYERRIKEHDV